MKVKGYLFDSSDSDNEHKRQDAGDGTDRSVNQQLKCGLGAHAGLHSKL